MLNRASNQTVPPRATRANSEKPGRDQPGRKTFAEKKLADLAKRIRICIKCPLHRSRTLAVPGQGQPAARVMILGEAPGKQEDQTGRPFVGSSGKYLDHVLEGTGLNRNDFFITNMVKCRPPGNRTPRTEEVETCTKLYLAEQTQQVDPKIILLLGGVAVKKMLGLKNVEEARGRIIEREGRKFLATYHPAVRFYRDDLAEKLKEDFDFLKRELKKETARSPRAISEAARGPRSG